MSLPVGLRAQAEREVADAMVYYENQRVGLGDAFERELASVLNRISERPEICQVAFSNIRRAVLRRFPYVVYFRHHPQLIEVLAVFHAKRDPRALSDRE